MCGLDTYDARSKESHRGWAVNRIIERLSVPVDKAVVMYLVGPEDIDGTLFLRKGFSEANLIAVDVNSQAVKSARMGGRIAVNENISSVLSCWNDSPLDVLHLDTCSTVSTCVKLINNAHHGGAISDRSVIYCNMQRGREKRPERVQSQKSLYGDHRGEWLFHTVTSRVAFMDSFKFCDDKSRPKVWIACLDVLLAELLDHCRPAYASYRSNRVVMDSVVIRAPRPPRLLVETGVGPKQDLRTRRKLAARKAVATQRRKTTGRVAV